MPVSLSARSSVIRDSWPSSTLRRARPPHLGAAGVGMCTFRLHREHRHASRSTMRALPSCSDLALPPLRYYRNTQRRIYRKSATDTAALSQFTCLLYIISAAPAGTDKGHIGTTRTVAVVLQTQRSAVRICTHISRITHRGNSLSFDYRRLSET